MSLTTPHKLFHVAVFGSILVVIGAAFALKSRYSAEFISSDISSSPTSIVVREEDDVNIADDVYGGVTPEETFALFLSALKEGETMRASKYFVLSKEKEWEDAFSVIKKGQGLGQMHDELLAASQTWLKLEETEDGASFTYRSGEKKELVVFMKNRAAGIWKIQSL